MIRLKILNVTTKKSIESCNSVLYAICMFNKDEPHLLFVIVGLNIARKTSNEAGSLSGPAASSQKRVVHML